MPLSLKHWLLRQLNARDSLDGVAVTVKVAVTEFGTKTVARELRRLADNLERNGNIPGWNFPAVHSTHLRSRTRASSKLLQAS